MLVLVLVLVLVAWIPLVRLENAGMQTFLFFLLALVQCRVCEKIVT